MEKRKIAIILGVVCLFLVMAICIQMKTVEYMSKEVGSMVRDNSNLKGELFQLQSRYNNLLKESDIWEDKLEIIRTEAISDDEEETRNGTRNYYKQSFAWHDRSKRCRSNNKPR